MAYFNVDIDISPREYIDNCTTIDKRNLTRILKEQSEPEFSWEILEQESTTHTERELVGLFRAMWGSRHQLDIHQIDELSNQLRDKNIL